MQFTFYYTDIIILKTELTHTCICYLLTLSFYNDTHTHTHARAAHAHAHALLIVANQRVFVHRLIVLTISLSFVLCDKYIPFY